MILYINYAVQGLHDIFFERTRPELVVVITQLFAKEFIIHASENLLDRHVKE